jgi:deoxyribodipyrimidine photolyase-related protein
LVRLRNFLAELAARAVDPAGRTWVFVAEDQLTDAVGPLAALAPRDAGIVLVESLWKARLRPYHRQRVALIWANQRHFALEQAARGVAVRWLRAEVPHREALAPVIAELGPLRVMAPAERELRCDLAPLVEAGGLCVERHAGWLTTPAQFEAACPAPPYRMDAFYRHVRRDTGLLMEDGRPEGGRFSFDGQNRQAWSGQPPAPPEPTFPVDAIKAEVIADVEALLPHHPGRLDAAALPATRDDAEALWRHAREACLPHFGPYEDAMSRRSRGLFHTRISALMNMHRLLPARVVGEVASDPSLPLPSREGFVRQVLGWREFVRHVHAASDGFRALTSTASRPGDAGWAGVSGQGHSEGAPDWLDGGAAPTPGHAPLPPAFWGKPSGLACLDHVVADVWDTAYGHHITRLMVLSNLAALLDLDAREVADWFWCAYADAWDWVVEPNVLGMGLFALGDHMTTKPYVSGAPYVARMSDYCGACAFDPKKDCPLTRLYWAYMDRHIERLSRAARIGPVLGTVRKRSDADRERDRAVFETIRSTLAAGEVCRPPQRLPL